MKSLFIHILSALLIVVSANSLAEDSKVANAQLDKSWGLLIGDIVTMTVELPIDPAQIDTSSLPHIKKRVGDWLYIRDITLNEQLIIEFQLINVAPEATEVMTPALQFRSLDGEFFDIEQRPFSMSPMIAMADEDTTQTLALKPPRQKQYVDTAPITQQLIVGSLVAVVLAIVLVIWNIGWRPRNRQPFAEALHGLRMLRWHHNNDPQQAVRLVHKAFNRTANKTIVFSELQNLFKVAPWLSSLETEINSFYQQSSQHFFSPESNQVTDIEQLKVLVKACRAKEKLA